MTQIDLARLDVGLPPLDYMPPRMHAGRQARPDAWWSCRWCGGREEAPMTVDAERLRALTHEALCPQRPAGQPADRDVVDAYLGEWLWTSGGA